MPILAAAADARQHVCAAACLVLVLGPLFVASQSTNTFIAYPFVIGATRCYSCGLGNYSNRSGAEVRPF